MPKQKTPNFEIKADTTKANAGFVQAAYSIARFRILAKIAGNKARWHKDSAEQNLTKKDKLPYQPVSLSALACRMEADNNMATTTVYDFLGDKQRQIHPAKVDAILAYMKIIITEHPTSLNTKTPKKS